jgi:23S rRNA pseudouridine2605 synthase
MRRRDSSGPGAGGRKRPAGRSGARSNSSRGGKPTPRSRSDRDDSKPGRPSKFSSDRGEGSKDFSKSPRGGKSFGRKDKPSGFSSRSEKPAGRTSGSYSRSRDDRDDSAPKRPSKFSSEGGEGSKDFSKSPRGGKSFGRRDKPPGFSSRGDKSAGRTGGSFTRSRDDRGDARPTRPSKFSRPEGDSKEFSKPRENKFDNRSKERPAGFSKPPGEGKSFDRSDKPADKKGFFSKLSRGGKSFDRSKRHDADFGESVKDYSKHQEEGKEVTQSGSDKIRLNKYISNSGVCSRREADELITMGLVSVNGTVITELGYKVNRNDVVKYDGKTLRAEKPVYILLNKPKGFLTTTKDPQERNTVMQIIAGAVKERVYPVGRLDRNTTGLLLLTNDGELTDKLSHPSYNVKKIYKAELDKPLTKADFQKIQEGIRLEEGRAMVDDLAIVSDDGKTVGIEIHIGWNRVIRRIFESLDYQVVKLDRSVYAGLDKKDLGRGHWRFLTNEEVVRLKHYK